MDKLLLILATWLLSDGIYSWILYHHAPDYKGTTQTFWKDHWLRLVRILIGVGIMVIGGLS